MYRKLIVWAACLWTIVVTASYYYFNLSYYKEKLSVFVPFVLSGN